MRNSAWKLAAVLSVAFLLSAQNSWANSGAFNAFSGYFGGGSCTTCHVSGGAPRNAFGNQWVFLGGTSGTGPAQLAVLAALDADSDGFTNMQEFKSGTSAISGASIPYTAAAGTPYPSAASNPNVKVTGAGSVQTTPVADAYAYAGVTVPAGSEVLGAMSIRVTAAVANTPVTLMFSTGGVTTGSFTVYDVYTATSTSAAITSGVTANANGSVAVAVSATTATTLLVVRAVPLNTGATYTAGGGENEGNEGCLVQTNDAAYLQLSILLMLLGIAAAWRFGFRKE